MLDRITLFGSRGGKLQPSRNGEGPGAWLAVSPQRIGAVDRSAAAQAIRSEGGLLITASSSPDTLEFQSHAAGAYHPPQKALRISDAGPFWVDLASSVSLSAADSLVVPEDRDAQDAVESLRSLLLQLPEDRQGLMWSALSRPDAHYRLTRLEEQVRDLRQAPTPAAAPVAQKEQTSKTNWLIVAAAAVLGLLLGAGIAMLAARGAPQPPEVPEEAAVEPAAEPLPVLTFTDLARLDEAIAASPQKDALLQALGAEARISAADDTGLIALAKLILLKADVKDLASLTPDQVVDKLRELAPDLGSYPQLLAQYACDGSLAGITLPDSFGGCAEAPDVNDIRLNYFNLLDFVSNEPAP